MSNRNDQGPAKPAARDAHPALRLHHVGVVVADLDASVAWYTDVLGFAHQYDFALPGARVTMLVRDDAHLELYAVEGAAPSQTGRKDLATSLTFSGINHFAFAVDDLGATVDALQARGVEIAIAPTRVPNDSGDRFAFIRDNEGGLVELFQAAD